MNTIQDEKGKGMQITPAYFFYDLGASVEEMAGGTRRCLDTLNRRVHFLPKSPRERLRYFPVLRGKFSDVLGKIGVV